MGDDDQEWEIAETDASGDYPEDYVIEDDDEGEYGISKEVRAEDRGRDGRADEDEDQSAEQAAIHIEEER
jgi:hypothetical protein